MSPWGPIWPRCRPLGCVRVFVVSGCVRTGCDTVCLCFGVRPVMVGAQATGVAPAQHHRAWKGTWAWECPYVPWGVPMLPSHIPRVTVTHVPHIAIIPCGVPCPLRGVLMFLQPPWYPSCPPTPKCPHVPWGLHAPQGVPMSPHTPPRCPIASLRCPRHVPTSPMVSPSPPLDCPQCPQERPWVSPVCPGREWAS